MLLKLVKRLTTRKRADDAAAKEDLLQRAGKLMADGDRHAAIAAFREYLEHDPQNVVAINDLAACLADVGAEGEAAELFELAHSLDDSFLPATVNCAKLLSDRGRSVEALPFLKRAKICQPLASYVDAVYANICMKEGDVASARHFQLRAWMSNFDNQRVANCYLFWTTYDDVPEELMASEHRFWAETVLPLHERTPPIETAFEPPAAAEPSGPRRLRIGYWSPDLRNHSVRYFLRPILENHDREKVEIFAYHDYGTSDAQTELIRGAVDHFHPVFNTSDAALCELIRSHDLDVLVELAGHTSHNRMHLMQARLARLQITGFGYPPTTGLRTVDAKLLDAHVATEGAGSVYAEAQLVLPNSFWCFDPLEEAPECGEPPMLANGFVTFGCTGNISKISSAMLEAWRRILEAVPRSVLVIRSINFEDPYAQESFERRLVREGMDLDRIKLLRPTGGMAFYSSYKDIDVILDTFPFCGGTTTCFATYMGVPVVTLAGRSLVSRMGVSILNNLEVPQLVAQDGDEYVRIAIATASDVEFLQQFRKTARAKFKACSLGNGQLFTREFEQACFQAIKGHEPGGLRPDTIAPLPAREIMRRAYGALRVSDPRSAQRIVDYCLSIYPDFAPAHLLQAQQFVQVDARGDAIDYLLERRQTASGADLFSMRLALVRLYLMEGRVAEAERELASAPDGLDDEFDALQSELYRAAVAPRDNAPSRMGQLGPARVRFVVACDDKRRYETIRTQVLGVCKVPPGCEVDFVRAGERDRVPTYRANFDDESIDVVVILQKNVEIHRAEFLQEVLDALETEDIVGTWGAKRWERLDWRNDDFSVKAGAMIIPSNERKDMCELQVVGPDRQARASGMAVLSGFLLAANRRAVRDVAFDEDLLGCETLLEEAWTYEAWRCGKRLAVSRAFGLYLDTDIELDSSDYVYVRTYWAEKIGYEPFEIRTDDFIALSVPVPDPAEAVRVCAAYFQEAADHV